MKDPKTTGSSQYATCEHFRALFTEQMKDLYLLSYLLTADHTMAQQCFVSGLDDCISGSPVFREWARSWARRIIVKNAIRIVEPRLSPRPSRSQVLSSALSNSSVLSSSDAPFAAVLALPDLERFVYVLSVLERFSDQDSATLLGISRQSMNEVRTRAFAQIAAGQLTACCA